MGFFGGHKPNADSPDPGGSCSCGFRFEYSLIHNGFNDSAYAYCDSCGYTAFLTGWHVPDGVDLTLHGPINDDIEPHLRPCSCGGRFRANAAPRCRSCVQPLDPEEAREWIERDAPGTKKGWRWEGTWHGVHSIVIENRSITDNWITPLRADTATDSG